MNDDILTRENNLKEGKTCIHCLNSEPYVCDIIWCSEHKKPTNKYETCEKFRSVIQSSDDMMRDLSKGGEE